MPTTYHPLAVLWEYGLPLMLLKYKGADLPSLEAPLQYLRAGCPPSAISLLGVAEYSSYDSHVRNITVERRRSGNETKITV
jgi:hypothetical protein